MINESRVGSFTVGGQPSEEDLQRLASAGHAFVVNVRMPDEPGQIDAQRIAALGLDYASVPFTGPTLTVDHLKRAREAVDAARGTVLIHCAGGTRAAVVAAAIEAECRGADAREAVRMIEEAGFDVAGTPYVAVLQRYLSEA